MQPTFRKEDIDATIVKFFARLLEEEGVGGRMIMPSEPVDLQRMAYELVTDASGGIVQEERRTVILLNADLYSVNFKSTLATCVQLYDACNESQRTLLGHIIYMLIETHGLMREDMIAGERASHYLLYELTQGSEMGKILLALANAFDVDLPEDK